MNRLARPEQGDPAIVAGESGGAGFAALAAVAADADCRERIGLASDARVLLINTEGATDPGPYRELTGLIPADVAQDA